MTKAGADEKMSGNNSQVEFSLIVRNYQLKS